MLIYKKAASKLIKARAKKLDDCEYTRKIEQFRESANGKEWKQRQN